MADPDWKKDGVYNIYSFGPYAYLENELQENVACNMISQPSQRYDTLKRLAGCRQERSGYSKL